MVQRNIPAYLIVNKRASQGCSLRKRPPRKGDRKPEREYAKMKIIKDFQNWRRYRATVAELDRLTNHELDDLGLSRADIPNVARRSR
jgi:uncharacterized protein YjiS (DUF1127 family)